MSGPLYDTLFRPSEPLEPHTTAARRPPAVPEPADRPAATDEDANRASALASAPPVRTVGTHTRAGNAMARTRAALLAGAAQAVAASGIKITMAQVAASGGVAKATLYNHFRTRDAVLEALALDQAAALVEAQVGKPLEAALTDAAVAIAESPVRRGLARLDPAALAGVGRIDTAAPAWQVAHAGVAAALDAEELVGTDTVLRWLASFVVTPAPRSAIAADVAVLIAGLPRAAERRGVADVALADGAQMRSA